MHQLTHLPSPRAIRAAVAVALVAGVAVVALAAPASAHVESSEEPVAGGSPTPVTFDFDHGCEGLPTTSLRVQIPAGVSDVTPENPPGWTSSVTATEVRWDGGSVPDGDDATFVALMTIDQPDGSILYFPTIQGCPGAENAWIEIPDSTNPDPAYPAPRVVIGESTSAVLPAERATEDAVGTTTAAPATTERVPLQETPITSQGSEQSSAGLVVFIVVVAVIAGGATVLFLRHRRPS